MGVFRAGNPTGSRILGGIANTARDRISRSGRLPFGGVPARAAMRVFDQNLPQKQAGELGAEFTQPMPRKTWGSY